MFFDNSVAVELQDEEASCSREVAYGEPCGTSRGDDVESANSDEERL
jgi:hypothetical protein